MRFRALHKSCLFLSFSMICMFCAYAVESKQFLAVNYVDGRLLLEVPYSILDHTMLFGSRIVDVNHANGKVYASGQMKETPIPICFTIVADSLRLERCDINFSEKASFVGVSNIDSVDLISRKKYKKETETVFEIVKKKRETIIADVTDYFSGEIPLVWLIPKKEVKGILSHSSKGIISASSHKDYVDVVSHYAYEGVTNPLDVTILYFIMDVPDKPMDRRVSDNRVGYTSITFDIYNQGIRQDPREVDFICRWRVNKGTRIIFYVDPAFSEEWFPYIKEGIEDWNVAFRAQGFGDIVEARRVPCDGTIDINGPKINMVRYLNVDEPNAKGQIYYDPRSGEILQGDILWWRGATQLLKDWRFLQTAASDPCGRDENLPLEVLGPMVRHAICHEMGHILGLSHNMGASFAYPSDSLKSVSFTKTYGTSASVMDYARYNHIADSQDVASGVNMLPPRIGPYDIYALGYGYCSDPVGYMLENIGKQYNYYSPFISEAIPHDPSAQSETLGDDVLRSSSRGIENCQVLMDSVDKWTLSKDELKRRRELIQKQYFRYITLTLSNIGGDVHCVPVAPEIQRKTVRFAISMAAEASKLKNADLVVMGKQQSKVMEDLLGNFLPLRISKQSSAGGKYSFDEYLDEVMSIASEFGMDDKYVIERYNELK